MDASPLLDSAHEDTTHCRHTDTYEGPTFAADTAAPNEDAERAVVDKPKDSNDEESLIINAVQVEVLSPTTAGSGKGGDEDEALLEALVDNNLHDGDCDDPDSCRKRATTLATVNGTRTHGVAEIVNKDMFRDDPAQVRVSEGLRSRNTDGCGRLAPLFGDIYFGNIKSGALPIFILCYAWIYYFILAFFGLQSFTSVLTGTKTEEIDLDKIGAQTFVGFLLIPGLAATSHKCSRLWNLIGFLGLCGFYAIICYACVKEKGTEKGELIDNYFDKLAEQEGLNPISAFFLTTMWGVPKMMQVTYLLVAIVHLGSFILLMFRAEVNGEDDAIQTYLGVQSFVQWRPSTNSVRKWRHENADKDPGRGGVVACLCSEGLRKVWTLPIPEIERSYPTPLPVDFIVGQASTIIITILCLSQVCILIRSPTLGGAVGGMVVIMIFNALVGSYFVKKSLKFLRQGSESEKPPFTKNECPPWVAHGYIGAQFAAAIVTGILFGIIVYLIASVDPVMNLAREVWHLLGKSLLGMIGVGLVQPILAKIIYGTILTDDAGLKHHRSATFVAVLLNMISLAGSFAHLVERFLTIMKDAIIRFAQPVLSNGGAGDFIAHSMWAMLYMWNDNTNPHKTVIVAGMLLRAELVERFAANRGGGLMKQIDENGNETEVYDRPTIVVRLSDIASHVCHSHIQHQMRLQAMALLNPTLVAEDRRSFLSNTLANHENYTLHFSAEQQLYFDKKHVQLRKIQARWRLMMILFKFPELRKLRKQYLWETTFAKPPREES